MHHIFAPEFHREKIDEKHDVVIVGAGISAAQLALSLRELNPNRRITMVSRHLLRSEDFDSDPGWLGPKLLKNFHREMDYAKRRGMIQEARNRGSLASEVMHSLQKAMLKNASIRLELAEIESASQASSGQKVQLSIRPFQLDEARYQKTGAIVYGLGGEIEPLEADVVVLATGFEAKRPGGAFIRDAIRRMNLPTAADGFPIVDRFLSWRDGLFVMGPLAELEVGPASRNISGARMAAERIIRSSQMISIQLPLVFQRTRTGKRQQRGFAKAEVAEEGVVRQS